MLSAQSDCATIPQQYYNAFRSGLTISRQKSALGTEEIAKRANAQIVRSSAYRQSWNNNYRKKPPEGGTTSRLTTHLCVGGVY
jgi:hypothetical protein